MGHDDGSPDSTLSKGAGTASQRLDQVKSHLEPKAKPRRRTTRGSELPADWSDVLGELNHVRKLAQTPKAQTTGYIRQKQAGKLWVRERVDLLLDPGSFQEVGSAAGTAAWIKPPGPKSSIIDAEREVVSDFTPSNNVQGKGRRLSKSISLHPLNSASLTHSHTLCLFQDSARSAAVAF